MIIIDKFDIDLLDILIKYFVLFYMACVYIYVHEFILQSEMQLVLAIIHVDKV